MEKIRKSILLIEDDPNDAALVRRALRKLNLPTDLTVLDDGDAAIRWFQEKDSTAPERKPGWPWIVLLDIKMPRMTGMEVLAWLRRHRRFCALPVIAFTSSRETADIAQAYRLGVNSYLVKPLSFDQLKEIIRMVHHYWIDLNEPPTVG
ncbi:MAG: response regulator [Anaerolineales bacterium]|nr:response regulator [Anaerolineales bacterium]